MCMFFYLNIVHTVVFFILNADLTHVYYLNVIHTLCSHAGMHLLVTIQLVSNSPVDICMKDRKLLPRRIFSVHVIRKGRTCNKYCERLKICPQENFLDTINHEPDVFVTGKGRLRLRPLV